jgi:D-arginine dehydrogenase
MVTPGLYTSPIPPAGRAAALASRVRTRAGVGRDVVGPYYAPVLRADVAIIGGGLAGASLARHLAHDGARVVVLERAATLGAHASGRNARLVMQATNHPLWRELTAASAAQYRRLGEVGFFVTGSLQLADHATVARLRRGLDGAEALLPGEAREHAPLLAAADFAAALYTPGDGVLDPHRLLAWYRASAAERGAVFALAREVVGGARRGGDWALETLGGPVRAERVVLANGAWASRAAGALGGCPLPLYARKRHLFLVDHSLPADHPFVWDLARELYFRPDAEGALLCACDDEASDDLVETVSPGAEARLREAFAGWLPALSRAALVRAWACLRTHSPDGLPVIGPDPRQPELWWLAALGGHGLGSSWEVGRLTAQAMARDADVLPAEVRPERFALAG